MTKKQFLDELGKLADYYKHEFEWKQRGDDEFRSGAIQAMEEVDDLVTKWRSEVKK